MAESSEAADWIGKRAERRVHLTAEMIDQFAALSGDTSAIHMSEQAALERGFRGRVVHGMLLSALVSGIIGTELPGHDGVLQQVQMSFRAPCFPGDEVTIQVLVKEFYESVQTLVLQVKVLNAAGQVLATGQAQSGLRRAGSETRKAE